MTPKTANPQSTTTIPSDQVQKKRQIADLISHIAKQDNHLWQALNSLQSQTNSMINQTSSWTSWNPTPACWQTLAGPPVPLLFQELNAYYMVSGQLLFINIWTYSVTIPAGTEQITIDLPVDIGETIVKTCAAWLTSPNLRTQGNGICAVEAQGQTITITINPNFTGVISRFNMGGVLGIIQTPNPIDGVNTAPR